MNKYQEALDTLRSIQVYKYATKEFYDYQVDYENSEEIKTLQELVDKVESKTTAKEMFEKIGYELSVYHVTDDGKDDYIINYHKDTQFIIFSYLNKGYRTMGVITIELHLAIAQQIKELGWLQ